MDPKLSNPDPNPKDAYNRVMKSPSSAPSSASPAGNTPLSQPLQPPSPPPPQPQTPSPLPAAAPAATPIPQQTQASTSGTTIAFNSGNSQAATEIKHGGSKIKHIIMGLGIIIFLVAYTFVWIYVFKLDVPFLPKF